ncbi:GAF domain-containing protein [Sphingosinicella sp. BN140058]|uniref:GAF domain-containing protein n=1 Tax=Sphingosinicella sp. BN140058 TaxID=1892855 RepID=UPI001012A88F|nr:GAF domain-containing protein [Sphingosinicella sp. BN140058]QAY77160.1 GAF domain-containing protein [Sphingosinicella sp. BN140058]
MRRSFYAPAPFPDDEHARQRIVNALLDTDLDRGRLRLLVEEAARLLSVPIAAVTILDGPRQWLAACVGLPVETTPRCQAFCGYTIERRGTLFSVADALEDERFAGNPLVTGAPHIRFYAGAPLILEGAAIGALCVIDIAPRPAPSEAQAAHLLRLAEVATAFLELDLRAGGGDAARTPASSGAGAL